MKYPKAPHYSRSRSKPILNQVGKQKGDGMLTTQDKILIEQRISNEKPSMGTAYLLAIFLGLFGGHRFYLGRKGSAITMLILTCTILGIVITLIWHFVDLFLIPGMIREKIEELRRDFTMQALANSSDGLAAATV
jgi:TM2 domain-containing membrane protein YozV